MNDAARVYVVARVAWDVDAGSRVVGIDRRDAAGEDRRFVPVAAFADRAAAEAYVRARELEAARVFNPFEMLGSTSALTSLPPDEFARRLSALVGPPPDAPLDAYGRLKHWRSWWDDHQPAWPDDTLAAVWELLDAVRFYDVLEVDAE